MLSEAERQAIVTEKLRKEDRRPLPVDHVFRDTRLIGGVHVPVGTQARGSFAVLDVPWRDDLDLVSYRRSPWAVLRSDVRRMIQTSMMFRFSAGGSDSLSVTDVGGTGRTLQINSTGANQPTFNVSLGTAADQIILRWGSSSTAATGNDSQLTAQVDSFNASSFSRDTSLFTDTFSGSKVYAGANTTAREIGPSVKYADNGGTVRDTLFDHTVISDATVNTGQTAAESYVVQY